MELSMHSTNINNGKFAELTESLVQTIEVGTCQNLKITGLWQEFFIFKSCWKLCKTIKNTSKVPPRMAVGVGQ